MKHKKGNHVANGTYSAQTNRRKQVRYGSGSRGNVFVCARQAGFSIVGEMIDISLEGLSFRYLNGENTAAAPGELEIISLEGKGIKRMSVKFQLINDFELANEFFPGPPLFRRCGVKFAALSKAQRAQLASFIADRAV